MVVACSCAGGEVDWFRIFNPQVWPLGKCGLRPQGQE
jgi:hypothetical protein